ncbi:MAG: hypothetical protein ACAH17_00970, partial [Candidatus Paceibacterota bacterium]
MKNRGGYQGTCYSDDVKEALGAIGHALRQDSWTVPEVCHLFKRAGYAAGEESVRRWSNAAGRGQPVVSRSKGTGAGKKLDDEQREVAAGWVLRHEEKVGLRRYPGFISDAFGVDISPSTASSYLAEFDLTRRMMGSRPRDPGVTFEQYAQEGYDYIVGLHNDGFFLQDASLVWAVDFTSTAIRQQRYHTSDGKGSKQKKYTKQEHVHTDNIFTALDLDGSTIEPHAFSSNEELRPGSPVKAQLCQKYGVNADTVLYCPDSGNWVGETSSMVYTVVKKYDWQGCYVIHDDG